ncbi:MAG: CapA family protein, partial [Oscillospiraceae bacterium]
MTADNLGYVFERIQYFEDDDFTMANFECVLSDYDVPADKNFTFRAPPLYVDILTLGSVEFVTLGNNHVEDYGEQGYADTKATLDAAGIGYAGRDEYT